MPVVVRECSPDDWRQWREVRLRALAGAPEAFGSTLADWSGVRDTEERWRDRLDSVPLNLVAFVDGEAVGQMSGVADDGDGLVDVISVWVDPAVRGSGVGDALLLRIVEWAALRQADGVKLSVKAMNRHAIALYERQGFVLRGPSPDGDDELLMTKLL